MIKLVKVIYDNTKSKILFNQEFNEKVDVNPSMHQGSILIPLLLIVALEAFCLSVINLELVAHGNFSILAV